MLSVDETNDSLTGIVPIYMELFLFKPIILTFRLPIAINFIVTSATKGVVTPPTFSVRF